MLVGLAERGHSAERLVAEWQDSGLNSLPLYNFLLGRFTGDQGAFRPSRSKRAWEELENDLIQRLGLSEHSCA